MLLLSKICGSNIKEEIRFIAFKIDFGKLSFLPSNPQETDCQKVLWAHKDILYLAPSLLRKGKIIKKELPIFLTAVITYLYFALSLSKVSHWR